MFNPLYGGFPPRSRAQIRRMRDLLRGTYGFPMGQMDDMWTPMPVPMLPTFLNPPFDRFGWPPLPAPFDVMALPLPPLPISPADDIDHRGEIVEEFESDLTSNIILPFERAAATLNDAIDTTMRFCKQIEGQFNNDMSSISAWADQKDIDALWVKRLDWDGSPTGGNQGGQQGGEQQRESGGSWSTTTKMSYNVVMANLYRAIDELKMSDAVRELRVDEGELSAQGQGPERVRTALNKLFVTFLGIKDLVETVRTRRSRMSALDKELNAAKNILHDTRDLWMQHRGGVERGHGSGGGLARPGYTVIY